MSAISRGTRNAFRNPLRTMSVTIILGVALGMVVVMLAARSAVDQRITEIKTSIGNTVTVSPAGARGFLGGGEPLTASQVASIKTIPNVTAVDATIDSQLSASDTTLKSATESGTLGGRGFRAIRGSISGGTGQVQALPEDFTPPIFAIGTNSSTYAGGMIGSAITLSSGTMPDMSGNADVAVVGKGLAEKNSLVVGSTFTAFDTSVTVAGIYDAGNEFSNNSVVFPLATLQRLSDQVDAVTTAVARVNSVDNLATATTAIKAMLGEAADVTSSEESVTSAIQPLSNIKTISLTSLVGAIAAAIVITLLTMVMIVRERRKEIAVLKAIGAGDGTIVTQFVSESVVVSLLGSVVGTVLGIILSNPILKALMQSSTSSEFTAGEGPGRGIRIAVGGLRAVQGAVRDLTAVVDIQLILYGVGVAVLVAIIGSAIPAWIIGQVRPAEVLRNE